MSTTSLILLLSVFCIAMFALVVWMLYTQRKALKQNQGRIAALQDMLKKQYANRVESIRVIVSAMLDQQCEYTEGCIRLKQLIEQVEPKLLEREDMAVIALMYSETEHMPIKEQWKELEKKAKQKFTQQRLNLETKHQADIHAAVLSLKQHEFAGYQNLG